MITGKKNTANAVGGKTARACENCLCKRARWYCTADDAFLCQTCDSSVHSANLLARRHERVRLDKVAAPKPLGSTSLEPTWHHGVMKKARTPRSTKPAAKLVKDQEEKEQIFHPSDLVPEINEENSPHEDEEQLLYRVPIFDNFLCDVSNEMENSFNTIQALDLPSDMADMEEFAADVESLLGGGIDYKNPCEIHDLGFLDCIEQEENIPIFDDCMVEDRKLIKVEDDVINCDVAEEVIKAVMAGDCEEEYAEPKMFLRLDYEGVINAWDCKGCPWTNGTKPDMNLGDCLPDFKGSQLHATSQQWIGGQVRRDDVGREARVTRYREKRRTRLFSKKIRYQVRKLNADKRPRMKGRFVKRSSLLPSSFAHPPSYDNYHIL